MNERMEILQAEMHELARARDEARAQRDQARRERDELLHRCELCPDRDEAEEVLQRTAYCTCGASVELVGCSKGCAYAILQEWHTAHHGHGHGDTDEATARRARRGREAGAEAEEE